MRRRRLAVMWLLVVALAVVGCSSRPVDGAARPTSTVAGRGATAGPGPKATTTSAPHHPLLDPAAREAPAAVERRARALLHSHYVDLSINEGQTAYIVGVNGVATADFPRLAAAIQRIVPIHLAERPHTVAFVEHLGHVLGRDLGSDADWNRLGITMFGADPHRGTVDIQVSSVAHRADLRRVIAHQPGLTPEQRHAVRITIGGPART